MDPKAFLGGLSRETRIRRDAEGRWFHEDQPLEHPNLVRAFDRWIDKAEDGRYCLRNDINWAYITLEGAPLFVRGLHAEPSGVVLRLSDEREEALDPTTLRQDPHGVLYCDSTERGLTARFDAHAAVQLETVLQEDAQGVFLALQGRKIRPPVVDDPLVETGAR